MSKSSKSILTLSLATVAFALPAAAWAAPLTPVTIFFDAAVSVKLLILALLAATVAAIVICALKLLSGPKLTGGSAFLSGLRLGGPLIGLLGAAYTGLMIFIGLSNMAGPVPMQVIAPGIAEALFILGLGVLAGSVAVIANWAVEARIDRTVLKV